MKAQCSLASATICGVEAVPVTVEVAVSCGLPGVHIVGMGDVAVQEARERVRAACKAAGFAMPNDKIVVNLAPSDLRKSGSGFDLPIALGILAASGQIDPETLRGKLFVGELSLEGSVRPVAGTLAFGICADRVGVALVCSSESPWVPLESLEQLGISHLGSLHIEEPYCAIEGVACVAEATAAPDFRDVAGHESAKRALQISAAGRHGLLMMGPPGSGKTMLASRIPSILPPLTEAERLEAAVVHSVAGEDVEPILAGMRPFRSPHHTATTAGLIGGGRPLRPGEVSLAHCGVLFLDELAEFRGSTLQSLRQPMESGKVCITRADGKMTLPARFMLVAASNPCPCGYYGDDEHECSCTLPQIQSYQSKIGGPLLDRISLQLDVRRLDPSCVLDSGCGTDSATLRAGVIAARSFASWRERHVACGSRDDRKPRTPREIIDACEMTEEGRLFILSMAQAYSLSGRALVSVLNVARTVADLEESQRVCADHLAEALGFRLRSGGMRS